MEETKKGFKIKFRGVRGSYPTPKRDFLNFGGNTACVEVQCGKQLIILDAGTGIIDVGDDAVKNLYNENKKDFYNATIILSHLHQDHIQGLQFYKPLFIQNSNINLFGMCFDSENLKDVIKSLLFDKAFPLGLNEICSNFKISDFSEKNILIISQDGNIKLLNSGSLKYSVKDDDIVITSFKITSHPKNGCLSIKIKYNNKTLVYATDKEDCFENRQFIEFAKDCNCLIHDAQYTTKDYANPILPKQGFGHSTYEMAIEASKLSNARNTFFFHYDPEYNDSKLCALENKYRSDKNNIFFAKENYEFIL